MVDRIDVPRIGAQGELIHYEIFYPAAGVYKEADLLMFIIAKPQACSHVRLDR